MRKIYLILLCAGSIIVTAQSVSADFESIISQQIIPAGSDFEGSGFTTFSTEGDSSSIAVTVPVPNRFEISYTVGAATDYAGVSFDPTFFSSGTRDVRSFEYLTFSIFLLPHNIPVRIELQTNSANPAREKAVLYLADYLYGGTFSSDEPVTVSIPLDAFANLDDLSEVTAVVFVFEHDYAVASGYSTSGVVSILDMFFRDSPAGPPSVVRLDHFPDNWGWMAVGGNMGNMSDTGRATAHTISYPSLSDTAPWPDISPRWLKSSYDVRYDTWAGMFMLLGGGADGWTGVPCDFSNYRYLSFFYRAESDARNPRILKIEIQDGDGTSASVYVDIVISTWRWWRIDLTALAGLDRSAITQINIIYEDWRIQDAGGNRVGGVYFDGMQFER